MTSQSRHAVHNMRWRAVDQKWEKGEEQLENQALPSDVPNLAQQEYFSMGARDYKNQGNSVTSDYYRKKQ